ncbi:MULTISPECIES: TetR/AcrR family transcriptional regulator [Williamsia]|uniref:TetR family transcriptional regulator n=1 Tax=Williamsia marianensis TaxID=85044 RepID=A0A495ISL8_WILMA|nr:MULTISPECIES: TetR/AcrR family transcriptional regulator [Williamsia]PZT96779.1 MAG: TetR/AcrR family transcriptional regulator [Gordonia sp. (in: high G+C Gram-positive bacteria)]RKR79757.1 TetR family transcriptional regulator [Williamsia muralis]
MSVVRRVSSAPSQVQRRVRDARSTRWDDHRIARRAELVDAAIRAIDHHGVGVSMDDIAAEAGVSKPKLYRYFGDKAGLNGAVAGKLGELMWESAQVTILAEQEHASVDDMIRSSVQSYVALVGKHPVVVSFLMANHLFQYSGSGNGGVAEQLRSVMEVVADRFTESLRRIHADVSIIPLAVASILGAGLSATQWWIDSGREQGVNDSYFAAHLSETTWGIINGAAATVGVAFSPDLPFSHPGFASRLEVN